MAGGCLWLTQSLYNFCRNGASSATATSAPSSQYYPVHHSPTKSINQQQQLASFSQGQAIGHIVDDEDEDMVPRPHRAANGNSAALDLSQKNGMEDRGRTLNPDTPGAAVSSHIQSGVGQDNLPILSTPTFVLSYPSFSVGASVSTAHASAESQQVASVSRGGDTDTALVIDEDYDC